MHARARDRRSLEDLGPVEGELLTRAILERELAWNEAFDGAVVVVPEEGDLPRAELAGGLEITVLGPGLEQLAELRPRWLEAVVAAGLDPELPIVEPPVAPPAGLSRRSGRRPTSRRSRPPRSSRTRPRRTARASSSSSSTRGRARS